MNNEKIKYFNGKLEKEKTRINQVIEKMKKNDPINASNEMATELSFYDNHPSDIATELADIGIGKALAANEISILKQINTAMESIKEGTYGICKRCKKEINEERLNFIPYAQLCISCQNLKSDILDVRDINDRPVEESVLKYPFGRGFNDFNSNLEFDAEDSYQAVDRFNRLDNVEEYNYDEDEIYTDPIEKISNEQYKNQLPD